MSKHTAGPWRVSPASPHIVKQDMRPISDDGVLVANACGYTNSGFFPSEAEADANARLIASAPDLLDALIHIQQVACSGSPELAIATEAIAKATAGAGGADAQEVRG